MARGFPDGGFVICTRCGSDRGWPGAGLCRGCSSVQRRYVWTPEKDRIVRKAWAAGTDKNKLTAAITDAVRRISYPRHIVRFRAAALGLTTDIRRPWTAEEREFLREHAGTRGAVWIARKLGRAVPGVRSFMDVHGISRRVVDGYSIAELVELMGVSQPTASKWVKLGLVKTQLGRVTEASLRRFVFAHPELYVLRRVNEEWFKALVFSGAAVYRAGAPEIDRRSPSGETASECESRVCA